MKCIVTICLIFLLLFSLQNCICFYASLQSWLLGTMHSLESGKGGIVCTLEMVSGCYLANKIFFS